MRGLTVIQQASVQEDLDKTSAVPCRSSAWRASSAAACAVGSAIARLALAYAVAEVLVTDVSMDAIARREAEGASQVIFALSNPGPEIEPARPRRA